jgi:hypothetical protein
LAKLVTKFNPEIKGTDGPDKFGPRVAPLGRRMLGHSSLPTKPVQFMIHRSTIRFSQNTVPLTSSGIVESKNFFLCILRIAESLSPSIENTLKVFNHSLKVLKRIYEEYRKAGGFCGAQNQSEYVEIFKPSRRIRRKYLSTIAKNAKRILPYSSVTPRASN